MAAFRTRPTTMAALVAASALLLPPLVQAHGGHDSIPEGAAVSEEPMDTVLWIHILLQTLAWGILMPTGMVLGLVRSRWHVPAQILATAIAVVGYFLGHLHKGRQFASNAHAKFATPLMLALVVQVVLGVYLRMHIERGCFGIMRKGLVKFHGVLGGVLPVTAWVQMLLGGIASQGFCRGDHLGQCLAHFIMGSSFIAYGIILVIFLLNGQAWLARTGRSQEFWDSSVIALWGCINTFTEHRWGTAWVKNDLQHTSMGVIWWAAGLVGIWLSRDRFGRPKRNLIPSIVIFMTGWGMSGHPQELPLSTMVHSVFGYTLMAAGLTRLIEISFILRDRHTLLDIRDLHKEGLAEVNSFQYLPPFLLIASGFTFMGATEEQMALLSEGHVTHVSYILILYSISFLLFLFALMLVHLYSSYMNPLAPPKLDDETRRPMLNGHTRLPNTLDRQAQDAREFELDELMSDDNDDDATKPLNGRPH